MDWRDHGITLGARGFGEGSAIVTLLTRDHGRHLGLVRGARSKKTAPMLQPGSEVAAAWRARLGEHLGTYTLEAKRIHAHEVLNAPLELAALSSICSLADAALPEREGHPALYDGLLVFLEHLGDRNVWPSVLVKWELGLLRELGFGLDLEACAVSGVNENLTHVSPRSGRAVSAEEAAPYKDRLLPLPEFLIRPGLGVTPAEALEGLNLTGYFLEKRIFYPHEKELPEARTRLLTRLARFADETTRIG